MLRHNSFIKAEVKICRLLLVKIEKILMVTYRTLLPKTTNFLKNGGLKKCLYLKIISYIAKYKTYSGTVGFVFEKPARPPAKYVLRVFSHGRKCKAHSLVNAKGQKL